MVYPLCNYSFFGTKCKPAEFHPVPHLQDSEDSDSETVQAQKRKSKIPWAAFFKTPAVWAVVTAHFCYNWGYYSLLTWLPSYFGSSLGLDVSRSSLLTLVPYVAMVAMSPAVAVCADTLI